VAALLEDLDRYRFVLTEGRFVSATGMEILENGTVATLREIPAETLEVGGVLHLKLAWQAGR